MKNKAINIFISISLTVVFLLFLFLKWNDIIFYFLTGTLVFLILKSALKDKAPKDNLLLFIFISVLDFLAVLTAFMAPYSDISGVADLKKILVFNNEKLKVLGYITVFVFVVFITASILKNQYFAQIANVLYITVISIFITDIFSLRHISLYIFLFLISTFSIIPGYFNIKAGKKNKYLLIGTFTLHLAVVGFYVFFGAHIKEKIWVLIDFCLESWLFLPVVFCPFAAFYVFAAVKNKIVLKNLLITLLFIIIFVKILYMWNFNLLMFLTIILFNIFASIFLHINKFFNAKGALKHMLVQGSIHSVINIFLMWIYFLLQIVIKNSGFFLANILKGSVYMVLLIIIAAFTVFCLKSKKEKNILIFYNVSLLFMLTLSAAVMYEKKFDMYIGFLLVFITICLGGRSKSIFNTAAVKIIFMDYRLFMSIFSIALYIISLMSLFVIK